MEFEERLVKAINNSHFGENKKYRGLKFLKVKGEENAWEVIFQTNDFVMRISYHFRDGGSPEPNLAPIMEDISYFNENWIYLHSLIRYFENYVSTWPGDQTPRGFGEDKPIEEYINKYSNTIFDHYEEIKRYFSKNAYEKNVQAYKEYEAKDIEVFKKKMNQERLWIEKRLYGIGYRRNRDKKISI